MESIIRDVSALDDAHRHALEDVLGRHLRANQRLVINVLELDPLPAVTREQPTQSLSDWTQLYNGLSDRQIEQIDEVAKSRANLTRTVP